VTGKVMDEDGAAVPALTVRIEELGVQTLTDQDGQFQFEHLPARPLTFIVLPTDIYYSGRKISVDLSTDPEVTLEIQLIRREKRRSSVVVTGTGTEHLILDAPVRTDLIPESFLRREAVRTLAEALTANVAGVRVENECQNCAVTSVRLNGLPGSYTQILEDGLPTFSSVSTVYALDQIPTEFLQSIEVVKGGASALYGPNAVGGVINLIRREPNRDHFQFNSEVGWQYWRPEQSLGLTGQTTRLPLNLLADFYLRTLRRVSIDRDHDGFTDLPKRRMFGGGGTFHRHFLQGRGQLTFGGSVLDEYRRGGDRLELPPPQTLITEMIDTTRSGGFARWRHSASAATYYRLAASFSHLQRHTYYGANYDPNAFGNTRNPVWVADAQVGHQAGTHTLAAGLQFLRERVQDRVPSYNRSFDQVFRNTGFYLQDELRLKPRVVLVAGARADRSNTLGRWVVSPRLNLRVGLGEHWALRSGISTGFRAPQVFDEDLHILAVGGQGLLIENSPGLRKEASRSWTASLDHMRDLGRGHLQAGANFFWTNLDDVFVLQEMAVPGNEYRKFLRVNGKGSYVRGLGLNLNWRVSSYLAVRGGGTFQQSRYREPEPDFGSLRYLRAPDRYGFAGLDLFLAGDFRMFLRGEFTGSMLCPHRAGYIPEDRVERTPRYAVWDLLISRSFALDRSSPERVRMRFYLKLTNLFDRYQRDLDKGPLRDAGYLCGPVSMRTATGGMTVTF